jgi:hypothetical protein
MRFSQYYPGTLSISVRKPKVSHLNYYNEQYAFQKFSDAELASPDAELGDKCPIDGGKAVVLEIIKYSRIPEYPAV